VDTAFVSHTIERHGFGLLDANERRGEQAKKMEVSCVCSQT
jgi:hypothetical protein